MALKKVEDLRPQAMSISFRANWFESVYMQGLSKVHQFFGSLKFHKQSEATPVILSAFHASHKPFCSWDLGCISPPSALCLDARTV